MATRPGVNPQFLYMGYTPTERQIIRNFSRYFYVTTAVDQIEIGNSSYRSFLMRPTNEMSILMNVEREIIVLFSNYPSFEVRSLKAFDFAYKSLEDKRVDDSLRFIVSQDHHIERSIRTYLQKEPEYPVLIPFTYEELEKESSDLILTRIRSNHLIRDLFGYQSPLRNEYFFFGREGLTADIVDLHKSGQNSSVLGLRKSGKTSTIYAIERKSKSAQCRSIVIDCQDTAVHDRRYNELLEYLLSELRSQLGMRPKVNALGSRPSEISDNFKAALLQILGEARSNVLVIFDEIENISPKTGASPHWKSGEDVLPFWQILRSHFQGKSKHKLTYCFVGTNPSVLELAKVNDVGNPIYLFAKKIYMPMLAETDTKKMLSRLGYFMGINFPEEVSSYIHQRFGGHPFFIRQLGSQINNLIGSSRPVSASIALSKRAEEASASDMKSYIADIFSSLRDFYPEEYEMLEYLASNSTAKFMAVATDYPEFTEHLVGYGIVSRRGFDFDFSFDAVRSVLVENLSRTAEPSTNAERWAEISKRRNALEGEIRTALFYFAQRLDANAWESACNECIAKLLLEKGPMTPRQVFSKNNSDLYFMDLLKFVKFSGAFGRAGESSELNRAFDIVNKLRKDAHANNIDDIAYLDWVKCTEYLEDIFLPPT